MYSIWTFWREPNCVDNFVDWALLDWTKCLITKQIVFPKGLNVCILKLSRDLAQSIQENNETVYEIYQGSFSPDPLSNNRDNIMLDNLVLYYTCRSYSLIEFNSHKKSINVCQVD